MRARALVLAVVVGAISSTLGCGKQSDLGGKLKAAADERKVVASGEVDGVVKAYVDSLVEILPPPGTKPAPGQPPMMLKWRKQGAQKDLVGLCRAKAEELKDTGTSQTFEDAALLFQAVRDYWLGREMKGPARKKEWEDGYRESLRVAAKEGAREMIPLNQHIQTMKELGREEGGPWRVVADFELLLPHLMQVYQFRSYKGVIQATSFSRVWQVMFELPRKQEADGPESYQPYRDRLCKTRLGDACEVPYESRDIVVRRVYLEKVIGSVAAFRSRYAGKGFEPILDYFTSDLEKEKNAAVVPQEYPLLPSTRSPIWSSPYTVLVIGPKGAVLETDDPADKNRRTSMTLMEPREDWSLDDETATALVGKLVEAIEKLREQGAGADYTSQVYYHFDGRVPAKLFGTLSGAYKDAGIRLVDFVGRRRFDGSQIIRRVPGNAMDEDANVAQTVATPGGPWSCLPIASLADSNVIPDMIQHFVFASPRGVGAGAAGKAEVTARLGEDLKAIGKWVTTTDKPTLIAVHESLTNAQMHEVLSAVSFECKDEACKKPALVSKLALGICADGVAPTP